MRDIVVADVTFINPDGETIILKDVREYDVYTVKDKYKVNTGDTLDLISVIEYGEGTESDDYKIFDHNRTAIINNNFSLDNIKTLEIPN